MHCTRCGATISGKEEFCPTCGLVVQQPQGPRAVPSGGPYGVGGWLLLLCILLTIVFPVNILYGIARSLKYHPDRLVLLFDAMNIALGILSLAAGVLLWRGRNIGVKLAKIFFVASPLHAVAVFFLVASTAQLSTMIVAFALRILALPFLFSLLWYWYLLASQRVRNTYPAEHQK